MQIWVVTNTSPPHSLIYSFSWQPSSNKLLPFTAGKWLSVPSHQLRVRKTTFSPPYPEHGKLPSILPDTFAQCDNDFRTAQCGRRDHQLKSAHVSPYINHPGEVLASRRPCLFLAVQLPIWKADWRHQGDLVQSLSGPGRNNPTDRKQ